MTLRRVLKVLPSQRRLYSRDRYTKESRGFAFVCFHDKRDAEDAMDGAILDGRELRVQMARRSPRHRKHSRSRSRSRSHSYSRSKSHTPCKRKSKSPSRSRSHSRSKSRSRSRNRTPLSNRDSKSRSRSKSQPKSAGEEGLAS